MRIKVSKIKVSKITDIACILFFGYAFFADILNKTIGSALRLYMFLALAFGLCLIPCFFQKSIKLKKSEILLVGVVAFFVCFRNQAFENGDLLNTIKWMIGFFICVTISKSKYPVERLIPLLAKIGFIHTLATWILFFIPSAYASAYDFWEYWPTGTEAGKMGYRAGLTNHYSHNGILLAVTAISIFSIIFMERKTEKNTLNRKKKRMYLIMFILTFGAIILTTKRAHFLFVIIAMLTVYYLVYPEQVGNKAFKLVVAGTFCIIVFSISAQYIPVVANLFDRFKMSSTGDSTMQSRFVLWGLALRMFLKNPIFGMGWYSFRYQYNTTLYADAIINGVRSERYSLVDAHNVYIQLLAETGIVGLIIYCYILIRTIKLAIRLLKRNREKKIEYSEICALVYSLTMIVFVMLYSFTGNCLYDITSPFYMIAFLVCHVLADKYSIQSRG